MSNDFYRVEFGAQSPARRAPRHAAASTPVDHPTTHQAASPPAPTAAPPVASDSVLVPLDQWNRLLGQLGNIHEAGQQLAEARERMGRAETENVFLKERIRDLRAQLEKSETPAVAIDPTPSDQRQEPLPAGRTLNVEVKIPAWMARLRRGPRASSTRESPTR
jgi:hypothetical protein